MLVPAGGLAQSPAGLLEEVVVTASRYQQRVFDSHASISIIDEESLDRSTAHALADLMRDIPGVQVTDAGQAGLKRVRIRGEESRRSAILVNSMEVTDHYEVGTPLTLHPAMVERIEVIRGSGSVLYGSRALSGVVNFLTRKGGTKALQGEVSAGYDSSTRGAEGFATVYGNLSGTEYRLAYAQSDHDERHTPQGEMENTAFENRNTYLYAGRQFGAHRWEYQWEDYRSSSDIFVEEAVKTTFPLTDFYLESPQRDRLRHSVVYHYEPDVVWLDSVSANAFYQRSDREFFTRTDTVWYSREITSNGELDSVGGLLQADTGDWSAHRLVAGIQYIEDTVDQSRHVETQSWTPSTPSGLERIDDEAGIETWALFMQDHWAVSDRVTLTAGLRQYVVRAELEYSDRDSLTAGSLDEDEELIGTLGLVYDLYDSVRLRANISQGYVYPSLAQLATGAYAGSRFVNPNGNLTPETSVNYEAGFRFQSDSWTMDASAFFSDSQDYIHHLPCTAVDDCPGARDRVYRNVGESRAHGVELFARYTPPDSTLVPYANLAWIKRRNEFAEFATWESGVPELSGRLGIKWEGALAGQPEAWGDLYLRGETSSTLLEPGSSRTVVEDRASWVTLNLAAGLSFGEQGRYGLSVDLLNLLNETYVASGENLYGAERSVAVKFSFAM